ncbi:MAG: hypothetical protein QM690_11790 [Sphingobium sp.]
MRQGDGSCAPVSTDMPLPVALRQESVALVTANIVASPATLLGGHYVVSQMCSAYNGGSVQVRYRGADGATMLVLMGRTASDTTGGTLVSLGAGAVVDAVLPSGSTGCNVVLARVP